MLIKKERTSGTWVGLGILALGIAIGSLARPSRWFAPRAGAAGGAEREPAPQLVPAASGARRDNGLATLELRISAEGAAVLQRVRDAALERGVIRQGPADVVEAEAVLGNQRCEVELRIKGDWTDHVEGEQWSYRIRSKSGYLLGMREFSIQAPHTRGWLWEWLVHQAGRRELVLAPRSTFVNVVQNGHDMGVYFLEEHFEKELLESQGRREGPIVIWDESTLWTELLQRGDIPQRGLELESAVSDPALSALTAEVRAYDEKRLSAMPAQKRALDEALRRMRSLRARALGDEPRRERMRVLQEMLDLGAQTIDELVDTDRMACAHALLSLFQVRHGLAWHNQRFYFDPVQERLEPILFDNAAHEAAVREPVPYRAEGLVAAFAQSDAYYRAFFEHLGRMLRSDWIDGLFGRVGPELARFEAALRAEGTLPPGQGVDDMKQRLRAQVLYLRKVCLPLDPVNFVASYRLDDEQANAGKGWIEVEAWATTGSPVLLEGFRFSNGSLSPAARCLGPDAFGAHLFGQGVVLPHDGRSVSFRFPMDERLANLETVEKLTRAIRRELRADTALDLDIHAVHRLLASEEQKEEALVFRRREPWTIAAGRPEAPTLEEALQLHPFLRLDPVTGRLTAAAGAWDVRGDLVVPAGVELVLGPGVTLRFQPGAALIADAPLEFAGSPEAPVVLEPAPGAAEWSGVVVLKAGGRSQWSDVVVRKTNAIARGGWILTGAVTFYRSPVTLRRCHFEGTAAEDALNVFGTDLLFEQVTFSGAASDSFDGDFVTGELQRCVFRDGKADGVDVSGSDVTIRDCRFEHLGDKAFSIGEESRARILGGEVQDVSVGVAAKDASQVEVEGLAIRGARNYALAAFVKKPEYGPPRLAARGLVLERSGRADAIAQTGCTIELDGVPVPTQDIDVEASYQEGVLGRGK